MILLLKNNPVFLCFGFDMQSTEFSPASKLSFYHCAVSDTCIKVWKTYLKKKKKTIILVLLVYTNFEYCFHIVIILKLVFNLQIKNFMLWAGHGDSRL